MSKQVKLQKKISVSKVYGKISAAKIVEAGGTIHVMRILGNATGTKSGVSDFGEWTALTGLFRAMNPETGETFDAANAFMPDVAQDMIIAQLAGGAVSVDFAFDVFAERDDTVQIGYTYRATPLVAEEDSPIARLEAKVAALLPAPATSEDPAPKGRAKK